MKILHIVNCGFQSGIQRHVQCLMESMPSGVETAALINVEIDDSVIPEYRRLGLKLYSLHGRSGHDPRIISRFLRVMDEFKPDILHVHDLPLFILLLLFTRYPSLPVIHTLHASLEGLPLPKRALLALTAKRINYWLPVSTATLKALRFYFPTIKGEVFFNPLQTSRLPRKIEKSPDSPLIVGTVARNAPEKDWPIFHQVENLVKERLPNVEFWNLGEHGHCPNACERIGQMDLFLLTSLHEELPTTLLEAFGMRTAAAGFIPVGGVSDILSFSQGPLRETFLTDRDPQKLADLILRLLQNPPLRDELVQDEEQILKNHFDASKNCSTRLMEIYRGILDKKR